MNGRVATVGVCVVAAAVLALRPPQVVNAFAIQARDARSVTLGRGDQPKTTEIATMTALPTLAVGAGAEALAINDAGTVIVGSAWDRNDLLHGVTWTHQNGKWTIEALPTPRDATSAIARGAGSAGAGGNDFPGTRSRAIFWPWTGGFQILGCNDDLGPATVYAISGDGQIVAGLERSPAPVRAAVWPTTPGSCRVDLPPLAAGLSATAFAVNDDGTVVGGSSNGLPVRWTLSSGQWQIAQLDNRPGRAAGANAVGDLAGQVEVANGTAGCTLPDGCQRAVVWYAQGAALELGTLGGAFSWARDINASGEVVGGSTSPQTGNTGFFWSPSVGMYQLPFKGQFAVANAVSDVRPDGTRRIVGMNSQAMPVVWVLRNP